MAWLGDLGSALLGALYDARVAVMIGGLVAVIALGALARRRDWPARIRRHPILTTLVLVPILVVAVPVGWYLASPLVLSATIDEPAPAIAGGGPGQGGSAAPSSGPLASGAVPSPGPSGPALTPPPARPTATATAAPPSVAPIARSGAFHGSDDFHFGRGTARLIEVAPGSFVVRLEDFAVRNGPDLYVYLSSRADGYSDDAIELGRLKADTGNQNYAVPAGALDDPSRAASVVIWCRQFSHLFATAPLAA